MTEFETVFSNLKIFHHRPWVEEKLEECKLLFATMSKEELRVIRHSRWMDKDNALYPTLFEFLYKDEFKDVVRKLNEMSTPDLIQELRTTNSSYLSRKNTTDFS